MQAVSRSFREEHKIDVANVGHGCVIISEGGVNIFSHETLHHFIIIFLFK